MLSMLIPNFNLNDIYDSGMTYGWKKVDDNWYIMHTNGLACAVKQYGDKKVFYCTEKDFWDVWYHYFTIDVDYVPAYRHLKHFPTKRVNDIILRHTGIRLVRLPLEANIVRSVMRTEASIDSIADNMLESMAECIGTIQHDSIQNMGKVYWKSIPPIVSLQQFKPEIMYSPMFGPEAANRLIDISKRASEGNIIQKVYDAAEAKRVEDIPDLLWQMGLEDDEVSQVMLYTFAQLDNCPDSLIDDPIQLLYGVDPISYHEWYIDDLGAYYGMFGMIMRAAYNAGDVTDSLTDKMGYQLKKLQNKKKRRNPWERRKLEGEGERWD